ncbi:MAG TPA: Ku protein [Candidatus Eisenbacteria bacterium]|nr:Ku protein [Candidatus Eisenbacteria bacterium]
MPIRSGVLSFGLVSIPVKVHPAIRDQTVRFHLLHKKCGNRIQNRWYCPYDEEAVGREDLVRGFEITKGKYVQLTDRELESVEAEANRAIELKQFVPLDKVDPVYFESTYYLEAAEGGEKPYRLLAKALEKTKRVAVAQLVSRGKEELVLIRPHAGGLVMHTAYYADEVRDFGQIPKAESARVGKEEIDLGEGLIERMSAGEFRPDRFEDKYRMRVLGLLEQKRKTGETITAQVAEPKRRAPTPVVDIMEALKVSLERAPARSKPAPARRKPAARRPRQKRA